MVPVRVSVAVSVMAAVQVVVSGTKGSCGVTSCGVAIEVVGGRREGVADDASLVRRPAAACVRKRDDAETLRASLVAIDSVLVTASRGGCRARLRLTEALNPAVTVVRVSPRDIVWTRLVETVDEAALLQLRNPERSTEPPAT
jgi:hypothetical protein